MSDVKKVVKIKVGKKVKFTRRNGRLATGKLESYSLSERGEWATVIADGKPTKLRPSQLSLA